MNMILIIEDDIVLCENIVELFEFFGYNVIIVFNGRLGIEKVEKLIFNIIICDIMMFEVDGYGVLEKLF